MPFSFEAVAPLCKLFLGFLAREGKVADTTARETLVRSNLVCFRRLSTTTLAPVLACSGAFSVTGIYRDRAPSALAVPHFTRLVRLKDKVIRQVTTSGITMRWCGKSKKHAGVSRVKASNGSGFSGGDPWGRRRSNGSSADGLN